MRIETHGQQIEVTPALRDYVETKLARLARHFDQPFDVRTQLSLDKPDHCAEANVNIAGRTLHADADAHQNMYAAIDLLADKLDRLLMKHKEKIVDHHRGESAARNGDCALTPPTSDAAVQSLLSRRPHRPAGRTRGPRRRARRRGRPARRCLAWRVRRRSPTACASASAWAARRSATASPSRTAASTPSTDARARVPALARSRSISAPATANRSTWCSRWPCPNISRRSTCSCSRELAEQFADAGFRDALRAAPDVDGAAHGAAGRRRTRRPKRCALHDAADHRRSELFDQQRERLGLRWLAGQPARSACWKRSTPSRAARRWPATSTSSIPTRCRSSAPRNWPGSTAWIRASAGKRSRRSCSSARWRW